MILRHPDYYAIHTENAVLTCPTADVHFSLTEIDGALRVSVTADTTPLTYLQLRFNFTEAEKRTDIVRILGDAFERGYGDLNWRGIEPDRIMPWYMLVSNGTDSNPDVTDRFSEGFGVKVQCRSIVTWQYDTAGITMWADIRNGGDGVILGGRILDVCDIVFGEYRAMSAFEAGRAFCRLMCPTVKSADHKVYGSNNWYYAYGNSSHEEILSDTAIVAEQCEGLSNRPYMVIDDGWQKNRTNAPWTVLNERFHDMKQLADEMKALNVRPGIWVRYLIDRNHEIPECKPEWRLERKPSVLDPSHPEVIDYIKRTTRMLREWGYELIKHDFGVCDMFGKFGPDMPGKMTENGWHYYDRSRTSAEIALDFYQAVRDAAGDDCVIIGCNTISHLCAGMYELNRTGDDTSGFLFNRTRKMGVNSLAFRLIQNGIFYMADADCVGITGAIPWSQNRQWLDVLAKSGSPLFVSCKPGVLSDSEYEELKAAWAVNSVQENDCRPLDWMENECPEIWSIDGEIVRYQWFGETGDSRFDPKDD